MVKPSTRTAARPSRSGSVAGGAGSYTPGRHDGAPAPDVSRAASLPGLEQAPPGPEQVPGRPAVRDPDRLAASGVRQEEAA
ncbi:MAG: hypothetical protein WKG07_36040 [Hymenobacter sp.]